MAGTLYVVATPIGNLEDITLRALRVLQEVALIATEDTRRTRILLDHYQIDKPLTSLHDHNERQKAATLIRRLQEGASIALVSEAGTPLISDPGYRLVEQAIAQEVTVIPVPGPTALVAALSVAGLPTDRFVFEGFLPKKPGKRRRRLEAIGEESRTLIFYESPRRVHDLLHEMQALWGDRRVVVARELTKKFEQILRGRITEVQAQLAERPPQGEVTLIVEGAGSEARPPGSDDLDDPTASHRRTRSGHAAHDR
jgi:16S rRNA (cytidine1402-2'-O)-methyltransferase